MLLAWCWQLQSQNAGIVDVVWTWGVGLLSIAGLAFVANGLPARRILLAALIGIWSIRLGGQLLLRVLSSAEDERYRQLKSTWGRWSQARLLLFYQCQAFSTPIFALPLLLAGESPAPLHVLDLIGVVLWLVAIAGEWQADQQLARFRAEPSNRGKVCQQGWWRYSRHPNYFFEWLHWCSYVPLAITAPWGWLSLLTPAAMYYFLNYVTGIPPAENQALRSRGDAYRDYQQRTNAFFPGPSETTSSK
jgi:steroid 5-alpha reductase family enzyme